MAINSEEQRTIEIDGFDVPYFIKFNSQQKNLILRVRQGQIHMSAPNHVTNKQIEDMIRNNYKSLQKQMSKFNSDIKKFDLFSTHPWVMIFGQKVALHIVDENINAKATTDGIYMKNYFNEEEQIKKLYSFLSRYYRNWFIKRTVYYATIMGLHFNKISIKNMTAKWGACYTERKELIFNIKLIHFDQNVIESVIVHELCHLVHGNHSKEFWALVYKVFPEYGQAKELLDMSGGI